MVVLVWFVLPVVVVVDGCFVLGCCGLLLVVVVVVAFDTTHRYSIKIFLNP